MLGVRIAATTAVGFAAVLLVTGAPATAEIRPHLTYTGKHLSTAWCRPLRLGIELFYCHTRSGEDISLCLGVNDLKTRLVIANQTGRRRIVALVGLKQSVDGGTAGPVTVLQGVIDSGTATLFVNANIAAEGHEDAGLVVVSKGTKSTDYCVVSTIRHWPNAWHPNGGNWAGTDLWSLERNGLAKPLDSDLEDLAGEFWGSLPREGKNSK